ncbi:riboflavin biosynthesis protein RibF [Deinococcus misasensis]|uniref:riboflavin biosynthesis protein RibF n=1 Tax=Deinococcus misasensis TaxID=392413 RepID=UPI0005502C50|nr:riboflavin biosynthesis protein RibF [Deinococcus misasensis]
MKTYQHPTQRPHTDTVIAIGSFDGVHLGHQSLLNTLIAEARMHHVPSVVYTFDPPTRVLIQGVEFLSTLPEKLALLKQLGIDEVIAVPFTREFAARPKEEFLNDLSLLRPKTVVVGQDFGFGKNRSGGLDDLRTITPELIALPMLSLDGEAVKSTRIRGFLNSGQVEDAHQLLGREYEAMGVVVHGDKRGRLIGFPTANVAVPEGKLLPKGVYFVEFCWDNQSFSGIANVGKRPTVEGEDVRLEVHLLDFQGDLYGQEVTVKFKRFIRHEQKFAGLDALKAQLDLDRQTALAWME